MGMSIAEIKAQADTLSPNEIGELSRYFRGLTLRSNPAWRSQLAAAMKTPHWVSQAELEQAIADLEKAGK
jgi:hypothetical protein